MTIERGKIEGDFTFQGEFTLQGMIAGNATAAAGARVSLLGMVSGDLVVEPGAEVELDGMVSKDVWNKGGNLRVRGTIIGTLHDHAGETLVDPEASIGHRH